MPHLKSLSRLVALLMVFTGTAAPGAGLGGGQFRAPQFFTTDPAGQAKRVGQFASPTDAYFHLVNDRSTDGDYVFQVTDPSGRILLSSDPAECRIVRVEGSRIVALREPVGGVLVDRLTDDACNTQEQPDGAAGLAGHHDTNTDLFAGAPAVAVQLMPFEPSANPGGVHKLWLTPWDDYLTLGGDPLATPTRRCLPGPPDCARRMAGYLPDPGFRPSRRTRTKNFKVGRTEGNRPPVADAGPDQTVAVGSTATLDGSGSFDPDGDAITYSWVLVDVPLGSGATLSQTTSVSPTVVIDLPGEYTARLVVDDGQIPSSPDEVVLSTLNSPPTADAGPDQSVTLGAVVTLDGSGSSDADNDPLTYSWQLVSQPATSTATLDDPAAVGPTFVADQPGQYLLELVVDDGLVASTPDTVVIDTLNSAPVADAGPDQLVAVGMTAQLDGTGSTDVDGDPLSYFWSLSSAPGGSAATISDPTIVLPTIDIDLSGTYVVQLIVNDGTLDSVPDTVVISTANTAPVADAGPDQSVALAATVTLDGSGSSDIDGDPLTYSWALVSVPPGSLATLSGATTVMPTFVADEPGTYIAQLVVDDGQVSSVPDTVTLSTFNSQPIANAGADQSALVGATVMLDGTGSTDPDGDPLTYAWSILDQPVGSVSTLSSSTDATPSLLIDVAGDYVVQLIVSDGLVGSAPDTVLVSTINSAPVADAGPDQALSQGQTALLDGTGSFDADGDPLGYFWSLSSVPVGSSAALSDPFVVAPDFVADLPGSYVAQLIVNDGFVDSAPDSVLVTAVNDPPVADAGPDQGAPIGQSVTLDGTGSFDPNGSPLTYAWTFVGMPAGSASTLDDDTSATPSFTVDLPGTYELTLVVNDGQLDSAPDAVTVSTINSPPVADAGPDQSAAVTDLVTLDGSGSSDVDGDPLTFQWTLVSAPAGSGATLSSTTAVMPTFTVDLPGSYVAELIVDDGAASSAADSVTVSTVNSPPVADAGPDQSVAVTDVVTLDGSGSSDVDGDPLTYLWMLTSVPAGSTATLSSPTDVMPTFNVDLPGSYTAELIVNDGTTDSTADTVTVSTVNSPPVANAGPDQTEPVGTAVTLDGSASTDVDGDALTYQWTLIAVPAGSAAALSDPNVVMPSFTLDLAGTYVAQLVVDDGTVASAPDTVTITTSNSAPVADAGSDQTVAVGAIAQLDGTGSSDVDGDPLTYAWSMVSTPAGSVATLDDTTGATPSFTVDLAGTYVLQLIVDDGTVASDPDTVSVSTANSPPVAEAGPTQNVATGGTVVLDGSASSDPDADPLAFFWSFTTVPAGSTATLSSPTAVGPTFVADLPGLYVAQLIVNDGTFNSTPDTVCIFVGNQLTLAIRDSLLGLGRTTPVTATLSQPAPAGGQVIDLSLDDPFAQLSATQLSYAAGETTATFDLTGVAVGTTTLRGSGPGIAEATAALEVTATLISFDAIPPFAPNEQTSVVLSITDPAPPQGLVVTLTVQDTQVASVSPPTVFIPAGQFTPTANAQLTGVDFGTTTLRATAPGYAPNTRDLEVALVATFDPTTLDVPETLTRSLLLRLDSPAPTGGITFDLSADDPFLSHPAQVTIPEGQIQSPQIDLTGITQGVTTLRADSPFTTQATAAIQVTDLPDVFLALSSTWIPEAEVGLDLQAQYQIRLEVLPPSPVDVVVSVPAGAGVLLSTGGTTVGTTSILFEDVVNAFVTSSLRIQGVALGDDVPLTLQVFERDTTNPGGYEQRPSTVDIDPSGVVVTTPAYTTTTFSAPRTVGAGTVLLWDNEAVPAQVGRARTAQQVRAGVSVAVDMASSAPAVATLPGGATGTLQIAGGQSSGTILVDPATAGTTDISIVSQPPGFTAPLGGVDRTTVTVEAPEAYLARAGAYIVEASVGLDLQTPYQVRLETAPPQPVDIVLSVPSGSGVLLSQSDTAPGSTTQTFFNVTGSFTPALWIQGTALADGVPIALDVFEAGTTTPIGYVVRPSTVEIEPSGIATSSQDYTTTSFSPARSVSYTTLMLWDAESSPAFAGRVRAQQTVRGGHSISVDAITGNPAVATLPSGATETLLFSGGQSSSSLLIEPVAGGTATISLVAQPVGFTLPTDRDDEVVVTVTAPSAFLARSSTYTAEAVIGLELQETYRIWMEAPPPTPVDVLVSVPPASGVLLATDPTTVGTSSVLFEDVTATFSPFFRIQGTALGDDVPVSLEIFEANTTTPAGYDLSSSTVDVDPAGVYVQTAPFSTTTFSPNSSVRVVPVLLWDSENPTFDGQFRQGQQVRGGPGLTVAMSSDAPSVLALPGGATGTLSIAPSATHGDISVDPLTAGTARIEIASQPSGLVAPSNFGTFVDITVSAPDTQLRTASGSTTTSVALGQDLQQQFRLGLEVAPPNPVDVTVEVISPTVSLVTDDPTAVGLQQITFPGVTTNQAGTIYLQGLTVGAATQVRVSAPGYNDWIADLEVQESGFSLQGPTTAPVGQTRQLSVRPSRLNANGTVAEVQQVRGGLSLGVAVTSSDPAVGTVVSPVIFSGGDGTQQTTFDALAPGVTTLGVTQPAGFSTPASGSTLEVTVN